MITLFYFLGKQIIVCSLLSFHKIKHKSKLHDHNSRKLNTFFTHKTNKNVNYHSMFLSNLFLFELKFKHDTLICDFLLSKTVK